MTLTDNQMKWLRRIASAPQRCWPDRPFLNDPDSGPLMHMGLVKVVRPASPHLSYATITKAGLAMAEKTDGN